MVDTDTTKVDKVAIRRDDKLNAESVIFAWGYWGWGNATKELVALIDAVEANRGFRSPVFVDVRKFRTVRARGFSGKAFETLLGVDRYHWLQGLGNETPQGPGVIIIDPNCVNDLLDIVQQAAIQNRRVLFFCSCEYPGHENETICCHRTTVARLIKSAAHISKWWSGLVHREKWSQSWS